MSNKNNKNPSRSAPYSIAQSFGAGIRKMLSSIPLPYGVSEMLAVKDNDSKTKAEYSSCNPVEPQTSSNIIDHRIMDQESKVNFQEVMPVSTQYLSKNVSGIKRRQDNSDNLDNDDVLQVHKKIAMDIRGRPSISQFRSSAQYSTNQLSLFSTINETLPTSKMTKPSFRELALTRSTDLSNLNDSYTCNKYDSSFSNINSINKSIHYSESSAVPHTPANILITKKNISASSPFYKGETVYGGSASVNRRTSLPKFQKNKPVVAGNTETFSNLSSTAKKIYKALEEVETVCKNNREDFPVLSQNSYSPYLCQPDIYKRFSRGVLPISEGPPYAMLSKPMISNASANIDQSDDSSFSNKESKYIGKIKTGKQSHKIENERVTFDQNSEEGLKPIELPNIKLKPFFEIDEFTFSQPITKKNNSENNLSPNNFAYQFKNPAKSIAKRENISAPKDSLGDFKFDIKMAKRKDNSSCASSFDLPVQPLKQGSVLDALKPVNSCAPLASLSSMFKNTNNWTCPTCMVSNQADKESCPCCKTSRPEKSKEIEVSHVITKITTSTTLPSLTSLFKQSLDKWKCNNCFVENANILTKCGCCDSSKPLKISTEAPLTFNSNEAVPLTSLFKKSNDKWTCPECLVTNNNTDARCPCCQTNRPATTNNPNKNDNEFKEKNGNNSNGFSVSNINNNYLKSGTPMVTFQFGNDKTISNTTLTNSNDTPLTNGMLMSTNSDMYQISTHCFQNVDTNSTQNKGFTFGKAQKSSSIESSIFNVQPNITTSQFTGGFKPGANLSTDLQNQNKFEIGSKNSLLHPIQFKPKITCQPSTVDTNKDLNQEVPKSIFNFGSSNLVTTIDLNSKLINTNSTQNSGSLNLNETPVVSTSVTPFKGFQPVCSSTISLSISNTLSKQPTLPFGTSRTTSSLPTTIQPINFGFVAPSSAAASITQPFNFGTQSTSAEVSTQPIKFSLPKSNSDNSVAGSTSTVMPINFNLPVTNSSINGSNQIQFNFGQIAKTTSEQKSVSYQFGEISTTTAIFSFGNSGMKGIVTSENRVVTSSTQNVLTNGILGSSNLFGNSQPSQINLINPAAITTASAMFNFGATKSIETTNLFAANPTLQSNIFNFGSTHSNTTDTKIPNFLAPSVSSITTVSVTSSSLFNFQPLTNKTSSMFQFEQTVTQATVAPSQTNGFFNFGKTQTIAPPSNQPFSFGNSSFQGSAANSVSGTPAIFNLSQNVLSQQQSQSFIFGQETVASSTPSLLNSSGFNFAAATNGLPQNFSFTGVNQNNIAQATPFQFGQNATPTTLTGFNFQQAAVAAPVNQSTFTWNSQAHIDQHQSANIGQPFNFLGNNPTPLISFNAPAGSSTGRKFVKATRRHR